MMKLFSTCIVLMICSISFGQLVKEPNGMDKEFQYQDASGRSIRVQNSLPKGGGDVKVATGGVQGYVVFWSRVINESSTPLRLSVRFPDSSLKIFPSKDASIKIVLPAETFHPDRSSMYDYGLSNVKGYMDAASAQPGKLEKVIGPYESYYFYVLVLFYQSRGMTRAGFTLKGNDLMYTISVAPDVNAAMIPCGQLVFGNQ